MEDSSLPNMLNKIDTVSNCVVKCICMLKTEIGLLST